LRQGFEIHFVQGSELTGWRANPTPRFLHLAASGLRGHRGSRPPRPDAAEPHVLIEQLRQDEAITEADTLLLTVPNQLGVTYNAHVIEAILAHVAPALGWR
jgi:hypothetical protein